MAIFNFSAVIGIPHRILYRLEKDGTVHMWTDDYYSGLREFRLREGFSMAMRACSAGEIGGTGKRIISVGAHVTRDHYTRFGIYYPSARSREISPHFRARVRRPTRRVKPDVSAPVRI